MSAPSLEELLAFATRLRTDAGDTDPEPADEGGSEGDDEQGDDEMTDASDKAWKATSQFDLSALAQAHKDCAGLHKDAASASRDSGDEPRAAAHDAQAEEHSEVASKLEQHFGDSSMW